MHAAQLELVRLVDTDDGTKTVGIVDGWRTVEYTKASVQRGNDKVAQKYEVDSRGFDRGRTGSILFSALMDESRVNNFQRRQLTSHMLRESE